MVFEATLCIHMYGLLETYWYSNPVAVDEQKPPWKLIVWQGNVTAAGSSRHYRGTSRKSVLCSKMQNSVSSQTVVIKNSSVILWSVWSSYYIKYVLCNTTGMEIELSIHVLDEYVIDIKFKVNWRIT